MMYVWSKRGGSVKIRGEFVSATAGSITVKSLDTLFNIKTDAITEIAGILTAGATVNVSARLQADGSLLAVRVFLKTATQGTTTNEVGLSGAVEKIDALAGTISVQGTTVKLMVLNNVPWEFLSDCDRRPIVSDRAQRRRTDHALLQRRNRRADLEPEYGQGAHGDVQSSQRTHHTNAGHGWAESICIFPGIRADGAIFQHLMLRPESGFGGSTVRRAYRDPMPLRQCTNPGMRIRKSWLREPWN